MLAPDPQTPVVPKAAVCSYFLQAFQIFPELAVHTVGEYLGIFTVNDVALAI